MALLNNSDVVQIVVKQTLFNQSLMNSFWFTYETLTAGNITLEEATESWWVQVSNEWRALMSSDLKFNSIEATIRSNPEQPFTVIPLAETGDVVSGAFPSHVAATFKMNVGTRLTRPGSKRLAGMPETTGEGNGWTAGFHTLANALELLFGAVLAVKNGANVEVGELIPYVFKKVNPANPFTYIGQKVENCALNTKVGSQNTRKP